MQNKITKQWNNYVQFFIHHYFPPINKDNGLPYLRDKLFISILLITLPICTLVYIPSVYISIVTSQWMIAFFDSIALFIIILISFNKHQSIKTKKTLFIIIFYILSIILFIYIGAKGPATAILYCVSILNTLFNGRKAGVISIILNAIIFSVLLIITPIKSGDIMFFNEYMLKGWIAINLNLIAFNILVVLSVATFVDYLNKLFIEEKNLKILLKKESLDLSIAMQKVEESDRLKSAFLANMSHEIRTPMNGILGFSSLLSDPEISYEDQKQYIDIIQKCSNRLLNIINEIMDISKIESGQMEIHLKRTNVNEQIKYIYDLLKLDAQNKSLNFTFIKKLPDNESIITTDKEKFYTIMANLIKNAIKYTDKGSIEFGYELKETKDSKTNNILFEKIEYSYDKEIEFFIKDTGIGISKDRQDAVFERFIQADIADIQAREGVGLGLSIAKAFVEMLNGRIWVESNENRGSCFYFTLPYILLIDKQTDS